MRIAVVAMGRIGLPLAAQFAHAGHEVIGVDIDADIVAEINAGRAPFPGEAQLAERLAEHVPTGRLVATTDYSEAIPAADVVIVVVPLHVDEVTWQPDYGALDAATTSLAAHLSPRTLVCYETTLPVGTTRSRWKPLIEKESGLQEGSDFHLAFSPERVLTGRVFADLRRYPKLVGGLTDEGTRRAVDFYDSVLEFDDRTDLPRPNGVWDMGSAEAAEMAKLAETTYRDVNIGLANQFAVFADRVQIDVHRVIDACNSQPYSHIHRPGIAVGGHCIPVYPRLYLSVDPHATIVRAARTVNASMPAYVVGRAAELLGSLGGLRVAVLGASYRGGVKAAAFSGVFPTVSELQKHGARTSVHDPMFSPDELRALGFDPYALGDDVDLVVVQADHPEYRTLEAADFPGIRLLLDGRRATDPSKWTGTPRVVIGAPPRA